MEYCNVRVDLADGAYKELLSALGALDDEDLQTDVRELLDCCEMSPLESHAGGKPAQVGVRLCWEGIHWDVGRSMDWPSTYWIHENLCMLDTHEYRYHIEGFDDSFVVGDLEV